MTAKEATSERIQVLCRQKGITVNALANLAGIPPSTLYSILNCKSKNPGVVTIHRICGGLNMTVQDFFDSALFQDLEDDFS